MTKYTINEVSYYKKFCNSIWIDPIIHRLHNFWWKLETYDELYVKWTTHPIKNINWICWFKPFFDWNANIFPWTFCNHYPLWNLDDFNFSWWMIKIIDKCYDTIDLNNSFCAKCDDNILNLSK